MNARAQRAERLFAWPVMVAALLTVPVVVVEQSSAGEPWNSIANALNWATWLIFLAEVIVLLTLVDDRVQLGKHHRQPSDLTAERMLHRYGGTRRTAEGAGMGSKSRRIYFRPRP